MMIVLFRVVFAAALVVYGAMLLWTLPAIQDAADGLAAFDMRPGGYTHAEALAFLSALSDEGRAMYLGPQRMLDTVYPALMSAVLVLATWRMTTERPWVLRLLVLVVPISAGWQDYVENARVSVLLTQPVATVTEAQVAAASTATVWKSGLTTLALALVLVLLAQSIWKRRRGRRP